MADEASASGTGDGTEDDSISETESQSTMDSEASHSGVKRRLQDWEQGEVVRKRRRRTIFDETEIRIPLEHGYISNE